MKLAKNSTATIIAVGEKEVAEHFNRTVLVGHSGRAHEAPATKARGDDRAGTDKRSERTPGKQKPAFIAISDLAPIPSITATAAIIRPQLSIS